MTDREEDVPAQPPFDAGAEHPTVEAPVTVVAPGTLDGGAATPPVVVAVPADPKAAAAAARAAAEAAAKPAVIRAETAASQAEADRVAETAKTTSVTDAMKDIEGVYSSKRLAAFLALGAFLLFAVSDTIAHGGKPTEFVMNDLMYIVIAGLGMGLAEAFAPKM